MNFGIFVSLTFKAQCPLGGSTYLEPATNAPKQCTPGILGACPSGFVCQATSLSVFGVPSTTGIFTDYII